jgi:molybdopterin synthase catalytic subunit
MHIEVTEKKIDVEQAMARLSKVDSGAVVVFSGVVRPWEGNDRIEKLHYEHYPEMAKKRMVEIVSESVEKWKLTDATVLHRVGDVPAGELSVVVAVSSERRKNAFGGCAEIIERIKQEVPIWKKDIGERTQWQSERN